MPYRKTYLIKEDVSKRLKLTPYLKSKDYRMLSAKRQKLELSMTGYKKFDKKAELAMEDPSMQKSDR